MATQDEDYIMSWDNGDLPPKNSAKGRSLEKMVYQNKFLKQMRAKSHGETASDIVSQTPSQAYRDNWDRIFGGDRKNVNHKDTGNTDDNKDTKNNL